MDLQEKLQNLKLEQYKLEKLLGQGKTCQVFKCLDTESDRYFAYKKFKNSTSSEVVKEITAFQTFDHKNIMKMHAQDGENGLVLELLGNGEVFDYVQVANKKFDVNLTRFYFKQLLSAVQHMHAKNYCHRDLKLENCILDDEYNLKLGDFGFSCKNVKGSQDMNKILGTDGYMAPEICMQKEYDGYQTDIFALGVILFIMRAGFPPFFKKALVSDPFYKYFALGKQELYWNNLKNKFGFQFEDSFKDLVVKMLESNPEKRITIDEIFEHEYMKEECMGDNERIEYMEQLKTKLV